MYFVTRQFSDHKLCFRSIIDKAHLTFIETLFQLLYAAILFLPDLVAFNLYDATANWFHRQVSFGNTDLSAKNTARVIERMCT
jgi:uncharacterized sodium:solute symporter family permease YidK